MVRIRERFIPRTISHYTTIEGLVGILSSNTLWASNASFLNDRSELLHALDAAETAIQKLSSHRTYAVWAKTLKQVVGRLKGGEIPDTYVVCFCHDDDNLSQWRSYSGQQQGISLTFDRRKLSGLLERHKAKLYRVTYAKISTPQKLRDALSDELAEMAELEEPSEQISNEERYEEIFRRVSGLLPKFKHLGFRDEREWRYVVQRSVATRQVFFRSLGGKVVPYIKLGSGRSKLPLASVRVGPGHDQELTIQSVKVFLTASGYPDVEIARSEIPFRVS